MRTTIQLDDDVRAVVEQMRREENIGVSTAVNRLIRRGINVRQERRPFVQQTRALGLRIDVSNVAEALEILEGPTAR